MKSIEELRKEQREQIIPYEVSARIDYELTKNHKTTIDKKDILSIARAGWGWKGDDLLEVFTLPSKASSFKGLESIRLISDVDGNIYFWDSRINHYVVVSILSSPSLCNFFYGLGSDEIELHESRQVLMLFKNNYKNPGNAIYDTVKQLKKSFPKIEYISTQDGNIFI